MPALEELIEVASEPVQKPRLGSWSTHHAKMRDDVGSGPRVRNRKDRSIREPTLAEIVTRLESGKLANPAGVCPMAFLTAKSKRVHSWEAG